MLDHQPTRIPQVSAQPLFAQYGDECGQQALLNVFSELLKGGVRTLTVVPGRRQGQSRPLAPFYGGHAYPWSYV